MNGLQRLKLAVDGLDKAREEHKRRTQAAFARMEKKMELLGEACSFVGMGASREAVRLATEELEEAARQIVRENV